MDEDQVREGGHSLRAGHLTVEMKILHTYFFVVVTKVAETSKGNPRLEWNGQRYTRRGI